MSEALRTAAAAPSRERAVKIIAKTMYKELRLNGYDPRQIVALSSELISLVTSEMKDDSAEAAAAPAAD
jgi:hypothetical protein